MRRALHFATREMEAHPGELPIAVTHLGYYLLFRAGASAAEIAAMIEMDRRHVSKRIMACVAALGAVNDARRARVEALVAEMGQINFEAREGELIRFPGPSVLSARTVEVLSQ
jgi:hypothetical protein